VPEVEFATTTKLPLETVWEFVQEMDNWATFVRGYQSHEKQGEKDSIWLLKGDVGVLARTVKFKVHIDEWAPPARVVFSLEGVNEPMKGSGTFLLDRYEDPAAAAQEAAAAPPAREGALARFFARLARFFFRRLHGSAQRAASANAGPAAGTARLRFQLRIDPGGPMAPMVNALMKPLMVPAAEDLANQILATLERRHGLV
jgi:carbon monoxide dehydrogenase subunit G